MFKNFLFIILKLTIKKMAYFPYQSIEGGLKRPRSGRDLR